MKYTRMGMLAVLFISFLMFSCDKGEAPVADFSADVTVVFTGAVIQFTDLSTKGPTNWAWTFGDQTASTEQHPTHIYNEPGIYTVGMTASNETGSDQVSKADYITVTVELTEAEKLVAYLEDPGSPAANYANTSMPAIKDAAHIRSLQLLQKVYIIDIRSGADYDVGHIDGAVNVAATDVLTHIEGLNLSAYTEVSIVCYTGQTAAWATSLLRLVGYDNVFSLNWGMSSWHTDFAGKWEDNIGSTRGDQFIETLTPKGAAGSLPTINTGGATPQEILEARVDAVFAEGIGAATTDHGTVYGALSSYYIVNYWPLDDYTGMKHIEGAMQYTPMVDLAMATSLTTLPTDETVVVYGYTGQTSANMAAYLRVIGYDAKSLVFGANGMIYNTMTKAKWNSALAPEGEVLDYPYVPTPTK